MTIPAPASHVFSNRCAAIERISADYPPHLDPPADKTHNHAQTDDWLGGQQSSARWGTRFGLKEERNMKSIKSARIHALALCAALTISFQAAAQSPTPKTTTKPTYRYRGVDMGTKGGPNSWGCVPNCRPLNNLGSPLFDAETTTPDPFYLINGYTVLGVKYQNGNDTTLNPLPGGNQTRPIWISDTSLVSGFSENGVIDPTTGFPEVIATLWYGGIPISLGTLGGNASNAFAVNDWGQVVGGATNTTPDPIGGSFYYLGWGPYDWIPSVFPVSTETHAFLWDQGVMHDLQTLGGPDSYALFINDFGQVAGDSLTNSTPNATTGYPTLDPFLWENGKMKDLGSLGGTLGFVGGINTWGAVIGQSNLAGDTAFHPFLWESDHMTDLKTLGGNNGGAIQINYAGTVVGWADLAGDQVHHAFLWQNGKMMDLGTVDGDPCSTAYAVNALGQVVGDSGDGSGIETCTGKSHGFLWENGGPAVDVTTLYAPLSSGLTFYAACCIGDDGSIFGIASLPNGDNHMMLLVPCDANHPDAPACHASPGETVSAVEAKAVPFAVSRTIARGTINGAELHKPPFE
jgi:probable HAF family extracellular repeat protein